MLVIKVLLTIFSCFSLPESDYDLYSPMAHVNDITQRSIKLFIAFGLYDAPLLIKTTRSWIEKLKQRKLTVGFALESHELEDEDHFTLATNLHNQPPSKLLTKMLDFMK